MINFSEGEEKLLAPALKRAINERDRVVNIDPGTCKPKKTTKNI